MSWSFSGVGKPLAVLEKAKKDLSTYKCAMPEEDIKQRFLGILETSLSAYPAGTAVAVLANGSQNAMSDGFINSLTVEIKQLYGFIE